jgi:hypothetical protein
MSAESVNQPAIQSANKSKKRRFGTISKKEPEHFTFSNRHINTSHAQTLKKIQEQGPHKFNAVSNETIKNHYGQTNTPKGGKRSEKRSEKRSGQKTRRHRSLRRRSL